MFYWFDAKIQIWLVCITNFVKQNKNNFKKNNCSRTSKLEVLNLKPSVDSFKKDWI